MNETNIESQKHKRRNNKFGFFTFQISMNDLHLMQITVYKRISIDSMIIRKSKTLRILFWLTSIHERCRRASNTALQVTIDAFSRATTNQAIHSPDIRADVRSDI